MVSMRAMQAHAETEMCRQAQQRPAIGLRMLHTPEGEQQGPCGRSQWYSMAWGSLRLRSAGAPVGGPNGTA